MERETIVLKKLEDTLALGKRIADGLKPGDVIGLTGPLGAGKTALTQAIAKGLGVTERLASPTFTVLMEYVSGRIPMCHFDVYRVHDPDELFEIGFEEYLGGDWVCVIEWADIVADVLPEDALAIHLEYGENEGERIAEFL